MKGLGEEGGGGAVWVGVWLILLKRFNFSVVGCSRCPCSAQFKELDEWEEGGRGVGRRGDGKIGDKVVFNLNARTL